MAEIAEKLINLPSRPGVYLMRDENGKVIYVGKAKDLRARVRAYFNRSDERFSESNFWCAASTTSKRWSLPTTRKR